MVLPRCGSWSVRTEEDKSTTVCIEGRISVRENHESPAIAERASDIHSATALGQALSYNVFHSATLAVRTVPTAQVWTHGVTCPRPHTANGKTGT